MYQVKGTTLEYADILSDGSVRLICEVGKKYSEIVVQNGSIVRAYAGLSHTCYKVCTTNPNEAIAYMRYCPECLAELLLVLSKSSLSYVYAKELLQEEASAIQSKLDKINNSLSY